MQVHFVFLHSKSTQLIDRQTIERIIATADIVEVVKEFVDIRKQGVNYKGLCPFHNEKTPSFTVSPSKQLCKCFSCGKGGNVVSFLMELEQMTYPEAIRWLGQKYGIKIEEKELTDEERLKQSERESLFILNEWAADYFSHMLHDDVDGVALGMAYFRSRGFRDDIIRKFKLGYSPNDASALSQSAISHGFTEENLLKTGLSYKTDDGRIVDRFHGRVIFPVSTVSGKIVAFGGRILSSEKKQAKYVNSPESIIYSKSHELYGLYQAKAAIVRQGRCFLVEGYTDVISMHQSGIENVVASSGTSLTEGQIRLLHRFTNDITILYDGDAAGIKASLRGIDMLLSEGLNIKVLLLPDGHDPDSFARSHRAAEFQEYIDIHQVDFIRFKTNLLLSDAESDPIKRAALITDIVRSVSVIPNDVIRQIYIRESAQALGVSEALIVNELNKIHHEITLKQQNENNRESSPLDANALSPTPKAKPQHTDYLPEERMLVAIIIRYGEEQMIDFEDDTAQRTIPLAVFVQKNFDLDGLSFSSPLFQRILTEAISEVSANNQWKALPYFISNPDPEISTFAADIATDEEELSTLQRKQFTPNVQRLHEIVPRLIYDFKYGIVRRRIKQLLKDLQTPDLMKDKEKATLIMQEYSHMCAVERAFAKELGDRVVLI